MTQLAAAPTAIDGLFASTPEALPFAGSLEVRAFLLMRERGNLLVYSAQSLDHDIATIDTAGGISRQYLGHRHEAMFTPESVHAPLFVHESERTAVSRRLRVRASFSRRHVLDGDFEVIPTPGHTSGATSYLWDTGEHRLLFTADTIYLRDGEWRAAVLDDSDRERYADSLELIAGLDFNILVPWATTPGDPYYAPTRPAETRRRIDAMLDRIWRGQTG